MRLPRDSTSSPWSSPTSPAHTTTSAFGAGSSDLGNGSAEARRLGCSARAGGLTTTGRSAYGNSPPAWHRRRRHDRLSTRGSRFAFLREHPPQSAGRWNTRDELTHYFCDTPDGAWAEFLRHEEIVDAEDLPTIRRDLWAVDIGDEPGAQPELPPQTERTRRLFQPPCASDRRVIHDLYPLRLCIYANACYSLHPVY